MSSTEDMLQIINERMDKLENKLDIIINLLNNNVSNNLNKMNDHIDLMEDIYETVKNPVGYVCNKINSYIGDNTYSITSNNRENLIIDYNKDSDNKS